MILAWSPTSSSIVRLSIERCGFAEQDGCVHPGGVCMKTPTASRDVIAKAVYVGRELR